MFLKAFRCSPRRKPQLFAVFKLSSRAAAVPDLRWGTPPVSGPGAPTPFVTNPQDPAVYIQCVAKRKAA